MNASPKTLEEVKTTVAWPPDFFGETMRRIRLAEGLNDNADKAALRKIYARDAEGCIKWIEDWCVTFDPRLKSRSKVIPFILFPKQKDFVRWLHALWKNDINGLAEKCRDIGATWLCCAFSVWLWLFHPGSAIGWGSRKKELVDHRGDPKAIFTKIRQIIQWLPKWMLPQGFIWRTHSTEMKILNPDNDSSIIGEIGDQIGRGGRTTIYFKDESAHYEHPDLIEAALGDNTNVQVDISSVNGSANVFYRRRMAGVVWESANDNMAKGKVSVFIFDWRDHPGKTQEWYDLRRAVAEAEGLLHIFAQEVDRDYSGSVVGVIIKAEWVRAAIDAHVKLAALGDWFEGEHMAGQDIADGGGDRNAFIGRHGSIVIAAEHWGGEAGDAARVAIPKCLENNIHEIYYDSIGVGAGFKTETNRMIEEPSWPPSLRVMQWNAAAAPLDPSDPVIIGDDQSPTNEDQYGNLKAQAWFRLRSRFYKTYRAITKGEIYEPGELISLPSQLEHLHEIVMEMSQPVSKVGTNGKTIVDKKPDGAVSPNLADALVMCFNPTYELSIFDVLRD